MIINDTLFCFIVDAAVDLLPSEHMLVHSMQLIIRLHLHGCKPCSTDYAWNISMHVSNYSKHITFLRPNNTSGYDMCSYANAVETAIRILMLKCQQSLVCRALRLQQWCRIKEVVQGAVCIVLIIHVVMEQRALLFTRE